MKAQQAGLGVDATGGPVIDPTANVIALNEAANRRQDDLRALNNKYIKAKIQALACQVDALQHSARTQTIHVGEIINLQMERLDKIRQVDVLNASTAAERVAEAVRTLAAQTAANQEANRNLVASSATGLATQLTNLFSESNKRLSALELSSSAGAGKSAGGQAMWGYVAAGAGFMMTILGIAGALYAVLKGPS